MAQPWVGLSWLDPAAGFFLPVLVLTFGKLSPHEVESWDGTTLDMIKHRPGLVLAFVTLQRSVPTKLSRRMERRWV